MWKRAALPCWLKPNFCSEYTRPCAGKWRPPNLQVSLQCNRGSREHEELNLPLRWQDYFFLLLWEITWLDSLEQLFSTILVICFSNYPDIKRLFLIISAWEHLEFLKTPITSGFPSTSFKSCLPLKTNFSPNILMLLNLEVWQVLNSEGTGTDTEERVLIILHGSWLFSNFSCPSSNNSKRKDWVVRKTAAVVR